MSSAQCVPVNGGRRSPLSDEAVGGNGLRQPGTVASAPSGAPRRWASGRDGGASAYTILVPANLKFRGVSMQLDVKIDQHTLQQAEQLSRQLHDTATSKAAVFAATSTAVDEQPLLTTSVRCKTDGRSARHLFAERLKEAARAASPLTNPLQDIGATRRAPPPPPPSNGLHSGALPSSATLLSQPLFSGENGSHSAFAAVQSTVARLPPLDGCGSARAVDSPLADVAAARLNGLACPSPLSPALHGTASTSSALLCPLAAPPRRRSRTRGSSRQAGQFCEHHDSPEKRCRQRAILGFRFCIRHILDDPDSPYQACTHLRKQKKSKSDNSLVRCTNAVRTDKLQPFCSTHLIAMGVLQPKKKKGKGEAAGAVSTPTSPSFANGVSPNGARPMAGSPFGPPRPCRAAVQTAAVAATSHQPHWMGSSTGGSSAGPYSGSSGYASPALGAEAYSGFPSPAPLNGLIGQNPLGAMPSFGGAHSPSAAFALPPSPTVLSVDRRHTPLPLHSSYSSGAFSPNASSVGAARSTSVASASSRPDSNISLLSHAPPGTPLPPTQFQQTPLNGLLLPNELISREQQSALCRSYPELASKLLSSGGKIEASGASALTNTSFEESPSRGPFIRPESNNTYLSSASLQPPSSPPRNSLAFAQSTANLSSARPQLFFDQSAASLPDAVAPPSAQPAKQGTKRVIRLKNKTYRARMVGRYRQIPLVNQMCAIFDSVDADMHDLYPLGLEPTSSDTEDEEGERSVGTTVTDRSFASGLLRRLDDTRSLESAPTVFVRVTHVPCSSSIDAAEHERQFRVTARRQLYLVKKQLKLERHRLLRDAHLNANVSSAARHYPNSAGLAVADRQRRRKSSSQRRLRLLQAAAVGVSAVKLAKDDTERVSAALIPRRCCYLEPSERAQCVERCMPHSNHCLRHLKCNVDQCLFRYCAEPRCQLPVLDLGMDSWQTMSDRCTAHRDPSPPPPPPASPSAARELGDVDAAERRRLVKRYPSQRRLKRRRPRVRHAATAVDDDDAAPLRPTLTSSPVDADDSRSCDADSSDSVLAEPNDSTTAQSEGGAAHKDADDSLVSVAQDLGFADLAEMLNKLPDDAFTSIMRQEEFGGGRNGDHAACADLTPSSAPPSDGAPPTPAETSGDEAKASLVEADAGGHSWADVEQFLLSEGFAADANAEAAAVAVPPPPPYSAPPVYGPVAWHARAT